MPDYQNLESLFRRTIGPSSRPVAIAFRADAPAGHENFSGARPSSCSSWRLASVGRSFFTVPSDQRICAISSCTHNISRQREMIVAANAALFEFHRARCADLATE